MLFRTSEFILRTHCRQPRNYKRTEYTIVHNNIKINLKHIYKFDKFLFLKYAFKICTIHLVKY